MLREKARSHRYSTAEQEAQREFVPPCLLQRGNVELYSHFTRYLKIVSQIPTASPIQAASAPMLAQTACKRNLMINWIVTIA